MEGGGGQLGCLNGGGKGVWELRGQHVGMYKPAQHEMPSHKNHPYLIKGSFKSYDAWRLQEQNT
jgi:hypothetical protein